MTDQELLQAMNQMMDEKLNAVRKDIMHDVTVLMDAQFTPQFKLLAEGQQIIIDQVKDLEKRIDSLEEKIYDYT